MVLQIAWRWRMWNDLPIKWPDTCLLGSLEWVYMKLTKSGPARKLGGVPVILLCRVLVRMFRWRLGVNVMFWIAVSSACVFLNVLVTSVFSCLLQNGVVSGLCGSPGLNDSFCFQRVAQPAPLPHCWRRQTNSLTLKLICQQRVLCRRRAA